MAYMTVGCVCRQGLWFWDVVVLLQTFALATALVFSTALNTYFQLSIMLLILVIGLTVLANVCPFEEAISQQVQVWPHARMPYCNMYTMVIMSTESLHGCQIRNIPCLSMLCLSFMLVLDARAIPPLNLLGPLSSNLIFSIPYSVDTSSAELVKLSVL